MQKFPSVRKFHDEALPERWSCSRRLPAARNVMQPTPGPPHQSGLAPEILTTFAHFSTSSTMNVPKSAGVIGSGSPPRSASRSLSLASARTALISSFSLATIAAGGVLGAPRPYHRPPSLPRTATPPARPARTPPPPPSP